MNQQQSSPDCSRKFIELYCQALTGIGAAIPSDLSTSTIGSGSVSFAQIGE
jgi:hypothetical protein